MDRDIFLILIGASISLVSSLVVLIAQFLLNQRADKLKRMRDLEKEEHDSIIASLLKPGIIPNEPPILSSSSGKQPRLYTKNKDRLNKHFTLKAANEKEVRKLARKYKRSNKTGPWGKMTLAERRKLAKHQKSWLEESLDKLRHSDSEKIRVRKTKE